jgi:proteasome accessory factor A
VDESVLFGLETEYGFTPLGPDGTVLDRGRLVRTLMDAACEGRPHLPDTIGAGFFLGNGSRVYIERWGGHPEVSTPECTHPSELVSHTRAGERLLVDAARQLESAQPGARILLSACNMDYSESRETWGCHESYLHRSDYGRMLSALLPHLVSRVVYTGAGGFDNRKSELEFLISPRTCQIHRTLNGSRWFANKEEEPLCEGYNRLHVVCGEPLRSNIAAWLKVGVTALIVRTIDRGVPCGEAVQLADPVEAMLAIARDPACRQEVLLADGRRRSALEIQEHYLAAVEGQLGSPFFPNWAEDVCRRWRSMLERLRGAPESVQCTLDWAIKHTLFTDPGVRRKLLERRAAYGAECTGRCDRTFEMFPDDGGVDPDGARIADHALRADLCELDSRFGQLGDDGIFNQMCAAGVIEDEMAEIESGLGGLENPPPVGRVALRAALIHQLSGTAGRYLCDWEGVIDQETALFADLKNPYETRIRWRPIEEGSREWEQERLIERVRFVRDLAQPGEVGARAAACSNLGDLVGGF